MRLNEGLPQKGKRCLLVLAVAVWGAAAGLNEGLPQKGKRFHVLRPAGGRVRASMKGFPRRGSDR